MLNCLVDFNTGVSLILCVLDVDIVIAICFTEIGFFEHVQHWFHFCEVSFDFL